MFDNYTEEVNLFLAWYERAKEVAIKAESIDSLNKSFIQPLHEQRYCLDHFIRAIVYEQEGESDEMIKKSITSAIGHLQRAYSDSIEWMLVSVKEEYIITINRYTNEQVNTVFPEYYTEIRPALDGMTEVVNSYKKGKSIEKATNIDTLANGEVERLNEITDQFLSEDISSKLEEYLKLLHQRESSLIEAKKRDERAAIKDKVVIPIITGIIGGLIVALIMSR